MKRTNALVVVTVLGLGLSGFVIGCEGEDTVPATPPPQPTAGETPEPQADADAPAPGGMLGDLQSSMREGRQQSEQAMGQAAGEAQAQAGQVSQAVSDQAQQLLDQAVEYIKENKFDLAEQALTQVEQLQGLSPQTLERVQQVRGMLTNARQGQGALQGLQNLGGGMGQ